MNAIIVVIFAAAAVGVAKGERELRFVIFLHRHGDRSPVGTYPNDPHGNESIWNNGWGQLTTAGKQNAFALGKWLRNRYSNFLPTTYAEEDFQVVSTDVSRTLMSAYLVLSGLYEPTGRDVWNPDIKWQPIPVHTTPAEIDNVLAAGKPCPRHTKLQLELLLSKEINSQLDADLLSEVVQRAGYDNSDTLTNFFLATMVCDSLKVQAENGLALPDWSRSYYPQPLQNLSSLMLRIATYNKPLQRLSCGLLLGEILRNLKSKSLGALSKKMWHYSAHDITIVGLRQCLGFSETDSPPYASALILELSSKAGEHHLKILYKVGEELKTMVIPGCREYCPLDKFEELVSPVIPEDWEAECDLTTAWEKQ